MSSTPLSSYLVQNTIVSSLAQSLRTGVLWIDMLVGALVASLVAALVGAMMGAARGMPDAVRGAVRYARRRFGWDAAASAEPPPSYVREIVLVSADGRGGPDQEDSTRNAQLLVAAVLLRMRRHLGASMRAPRAHVHLDTAGDTDVLTHLPPANYPIDVGDGVRVAIDTTLTAGGAGNAADGAGAGAGRGGTPGGGQARPGRAATTTTIAVSSARGPEDIDAFLDACLREYRAREAKRQRGPRCYLVPTLLGSARGGSTWSALYEEHELHDDRTFATLFIPGRERIRDMLLDFAGRRGRFARAGLPYRLGFMLSGRPGCGKTRTIKSIAHLLDRSVVSVPLARVRTGTDLRDLFYAHARQVYRSWCAPPPDALGHAPSAVPYDRAVFVLEDADAGCDVLLRRSPAGSPPPDPDAPAPAPADARRPADLYENKDPLTLAELLEVLDGIVEMPGRVIVLTTNRPHALDPALLRPGRIDLHIEFGAMRRDDMAAMLRHYYGADSVSGATAGRLPDGVLTAADVERIVIASETADEAVRAIAEAALREPRVDDAAAAAADAEAF